MSDVCDLMDVVALDILRHVVIGRIVECVSEIARTEVIVIGSHENTVESEGETQLVEDTEERGEGVGEGVRGVGTAETGEFEEGSEVGGVTAEIVVLDITGEALGCLINPHESVEGVGAGSEDGFESIRVLVIEVDLIEVGLSGISLLCNIEVGLGNLQERRNGAEIIALVIERSLETKCVQ